MAQRRVRARLLGGVIGAVLALGLVGAGVALAADQAVAISGFSFSPGSVTVTAGDTVTWTNSDAQAHTATADTGQFDTGTIGNGLSVTITFPDAGSFPYHCSIHAQMTGTVTVLAAAATQPPTDTAPGAPDRSHGLAGAGLLIAAAWLVGLFIARRRLARR